MDLDENEERILYSEEIFNHFCDRKRSVNLSCIGMEIDFMDKSLREILFNDMGDGDYGVNMETLCNILPNLKSYIDENGDSVNICLR